MGRQYSKERRGRIDASFSSEGIFTIPHSPEDEKAAKKLFELLRPFFLSRTFYVASVYYDENVEMVKGRVIQHVIDYVRDIFEERGPKYTAGNGIQISAKTISVRAGDGLDASSGDLDVDLATDPGLQITGGKLEAKPNTAAALDKDGDGIKVVLSDTVETGAGAGGGGLSFDGENGLRINPEDFFYLGS